MRSRMDTLDTLDTLVVERIDRAPAGRSVSPLDDLSSGFCGALRQPLPAVAAAVLLGRGGLLHPCGVGFLPHRLADSHDDVDQCSSAIAQRVPGALVEGFGVLSRG